MYGFWILLFEIGPLLLILGVALLAVWAFLRHRHLKWPWRVLLWVGGPAAVLLVPSLLNIMVHVKAYSAKEGRVIDTATGKGMPNVAVIAVDTYIGKNNGGEYREIVYTNISGDYRIPDHWGEVVWWMPPIPIALPEIRWTVTAFQPGYAVVGDELAWKFDQYGQANIPARSTSSSPSSTWWWGRTYVNPIKMEPVKLNLKESAVYSLKIYAFGSYFMDRHKPKEEALTRMARELYLPQVCAMDPEATMDGTEANALVSFGEDYLKSGERLHELEPSGRKDAYLHPVYHAKNVCEAMGLKASSKDQVNTKPPSRARQITSTAYASVRPQDATGSWAFLPYATISGVGMGPMIVDVPMSPSAMVCPTRVPGGLRNAANTSASWPFCGSGGATRLREHR